jgi:dihydrofolate synthase/folylpolyglutamate synthase
MAIRELSYPRALGRLLTVPSSPRLGLGRMERLLEGLGNPHRAFDVLHVAGTNGKGSTCAFADSMLGSLKIRRGLFTSPHLSCARERIQVEGALISEADFVAQEARVARVAAGMDDPPTFFERITAMAFAHFAQVGVEVAVVEVGLGGRLDATNVVFPRAVAIARIGMDHMAYLGTTLASIAGEKAGILKAGIPAITLRQKGPAQKAIADRARKIGAPLLVVDGSSMHPDLLSAGLGLLGPHQVHNAGLALGLLRVSGLALPSARVRAGLRSAHHPGRFEFLPGKKVILLDGAHNADAVVALAQALKAESRTQGRPLHAVVGMTRGHDAATWAKSWPRNLRPSTVRAVRARAPRSQDARVVAEALRAAWPRSRVEIPESVDAGLQNAARDAEKDGGMVVVTGSLYLVGEIRAGLLDMPVDPELPDF